MDNSNNSIAPVGQLSTTRGGFKLFLLSFLTLGIYALIFWSSISEDINTIASRHDGKKTMNFLLMFFLAPLTCGILFFVWNNSFSGRVGYELKRRGIDYEFNSGTFWVWDVLLACIIVGPFIYMAKMCKALNLLSEHYNKHG